MKFLRKTLAAITASLILGTSAYAQSAAVPIQDTDPVLVFNRVCYAQVPVVENIRKLSAEMAWNPMGGEDLKQFTALETPDVLEGWDVKIAQRLYRLGVVQSKPSEVFNKNFPDFKGGVATACTLILDGEDEADVILKRMNSLARKEPNSENVDDGTLLTTTWSGGNEDFKVFLFMKSNKFNKANLLNVTILSKE